MVGFDTTSCECCDDLCATPFGRPDLRGDRFKRRDEDCVGIRGEGNDSESSFGLFYRCFALRLFLLARAFEGGREKWHFLG